MKSLNWSANKVSCLWSWTHEFNDKAITEQLRGSAIPPFGKSKMLDLHCKSLISQSILSKSLRIPHSLTAHKDWHRLTTPFPKILDPPLLSSVFVKPCNWPVIRVSVICICPRLPQIIWLLTTDKLRYSLSNSRLKCKEWKIVNSGTADSEACLFWPNTV